MTHQPRQHRPGTRAHKEATYQAMVAYQEGASIDTAAREHRINPETLRRRLHASGFLVAHEGRKHAPKRSVSSRRDIVVRMHLDDGASLSDIAAATSMGRTTVRRLLIESGHYAPRKPGSTPRSAWSNSLKNRARILQSVELRNRGLTYGQIAIRVNAPRSTVTRWITNYNNNAYLWQQYQTPDWWA